MNLKKTYNGIDFTPCLTFNPFKFSFGGMSLNTRRADNYIVRYIRTEDLSFELQCVLTFNWGYEEDEIDKSFLDMLWERSITLGNVVRELRGEFFDFIPIYSIDKANKILEDRAQNNRVFNDIKIISTKSNSLAQDLLDASIRSRET